MRPPDIRAQLAREIATADLYHAARQYATVAAGVAHGDVSQELLRDRAATLQAAALRYAAARDWTPPPPADGRDRGDVPPLLPR